MAAQPSPRDPPQDARGRALVDEIRRARASYFEARRRTELALAAADGDAVSRLLQDELAPRQVDYLRAWSDIVEYQRAQVVESVARGALDLVRRS